MLLHATSDILDLYQYPKNALLNVSSNYLESNKVVMMVRKNMNWQYPEELMPAILDYHNIVKTNMQDNELARERLYEITKIFNEFCKQHNCKDILRGLTSAYPMVLIPLKIMASDTGRATCSP